MDSYLALLGGAPAFIVMIVAALSLFWLAASADAGEKVPERNKEGTTVVTTNAVKGLSRSDIQQKLKKLAETPPPKDLQPGACCYEMAAPPDRAEYVCPKCGEKTLYTKELVWAVQDAVPNAKRCLLELQKLAKQGFSLDESQFCRKCSPDVTAPKLVLGVTFEDGRAHTVAGVTPDDLVLLTDFLSGKLVHDNGPGGEKPLKDYAKRVAKLLGIETP